MRAVAEGPHQVGRLLLALGLVGSAALPAQPGDRLGAGLASPARRGPMGREYWLLVPARLDRSRPAHLVVLAHGFRGQGGDILWLRRAFAAFRDCVFLAPSFPEGFQLLQRETDSQLLRLFAQLRRELELHPQLFVCGFSAGAQFAHRFAMRHPDKVLGCAAHAGGTWGPELNPAARSVPMSLSCGLEDTARSSLGQTQTRVEAAHAWFARLAEAGFHIKARLLPGLGHATSPATEALIAECYALATRRGFGETGVLELPPRRHRRGAMAYHDRVRYGFYFLQLGLGGRNRLGQEFWVDDRRENRAGWIDNPAALKRRRAARGR